jgi:intein-encoded DNA endonuclease-like protein
MRHKPKVIVRAIHMHQDGMSFFKVQNHLWQHDSVKVSRQTLTKWKKKYSDFLKSAAFRGKAHNQRKNTRRREVHLRRQRTWL